MSENNHVAVYIDEKQGSNIFLGFSFQQWSCLPSGYQHCEKSVRVRTSSGPYFPAFGLNMERYSVFSPNAGKYRVEKLQIWTLFMQCNILKTRPFQEQWTYFN